MYISNNFLLLPFPSRCENREYGIAEKAHYILAVYTFPPQQHARTWKNITVYTQYCVIFI